MIISRTPLRISFLGGETDYPAWFQKNEGVVLSTTIDKYIYITARYLPPFFEHRSRIVWSLIERVKNRDDIKHSSVRRCLEFMKINEGVEIHYDADLPARTGLGSSSSFTAGLLKGLYALKNQMVSEEQLAKAAIYVEQQMIKENVGCQDQIAASYGGFNLIRFKKNGDFIVTPLTISKERKELLNSHLLLVFTGFSRTSSAIAGEVIKNIKNKKRELQRMHQLALEGVDILGDERRPISSFGKLLHESWKIKRSMAKCVSTEQVDDIYAKARKCGAIGGKLLGAGGGGFVLLFAEAKKHKAIKAKLKKFLIVPFKFEQTGSQVIFYNQETKHEFK